MNTAIPEHETTYLAQFQSILALQREGHLTADRLEQWRHARLGEVLEYVRTHSRYYNTRLAHLTDSDHPDHIGHDGTINLTRIPFTTKDDLRAHQFDVLSQPVRNASGFYRTTGTTGDSTPCPRSPLDELTSNSTVVDAWRDTFARHFGQRRPTIALLGPSELYAFGDVFTAVANEVGACQVKLWPDSPRVGYTTALNLMRDLKVDVVVCSPSICLQLAKAAAAQGIDASSLSIQLFLVLGEITTPQLAANVKSLWPNATIMPTLYGSQEALCIAAGCADGNLHLAELNYITEVIDPRTQQPVRDGDAGELTLTMLAPGAKPLIRYRTGDIVRLHATADCSCTLPGRVVQVLGRVDDQIHISDRDWWPHELESIVLAHARTCTGYRIHLRHDPTGRDLAYLELDVLDDTGLDTELIALDIEAHLGVPAHVTLIDSLHPTSHTRTTGWKSTRIIDHRGITPTEGTTTPHTPTEPGLAPTPDTATANPTRQPAVA